MSQRSDELAAYADAEMEVILRALRGMAVQCDVEAEQVAPALFQIGLQEVLRGNAQQFRAVADELERLS